MALTKENRRKRIHYRIRKKVSGTAEVPRMTVYRSNREIYVQFFNDADGTTLFSVSSREKSGKGKKKPKKVDVAVTVGKAAAALALEKGISTVVFDRNGYLYHGRVKALGDAAREGGLKF